MKVPLMNLKFLIFYEKIIIEEILKIDVIYILLYQVRIRRLRRLKPYRWARSWYKHFPK